MTADYGDDRVVCRKCGSVVFAEVNENGTFFGYHCDTCDDCTPTELQHFDGKEWGKV